MKEYQAEFESLANRIVGLPSNFYLSCFISGLKPDIRREVQAFQPISLSHAISLAKIQEEKHNDRTTNTQNRRLPFRSTPPTPLTSATNTTTTAPPTPPAIKRLSPAELQARRDKGLCYNCDEKFHIGHRCKRQFHLLVTIPETPEPPEDPITQLLLTATPHNQPEPEPTTDPQTAQISLHALLGHAIPETLRVLGLISKQPVAILVDSGSTKNFIQDRIAKQLGLPLQQAPSFQVLVGNGEELNCSTICPKVCLQLGSHQFLVDFFVVPLRGAELVLGVQWLKSLGPVLTNYEALTMTFFKDGQVVQLKGANLGLHQKKPLSISFVDWSPLML